MLSSESDSTPTRKIEILNELKTRLRIKREAEDAELIASAQLAQLRRAAGITQTLLAKIVTKTIGRTIIQPDISRLERFVSGYSDRSLRLHLSRYFRSIGYDVDGSGAIIFVPPKTN
jgi:hypothetical protein